MIHQRKKQQINQGISLPNLSKNLDEKYSKFIIKHRDLYFKKKTNQSQKVKKRLFDGNERNRKIFKIKRNLCLFVVLNIEKVQNKKNNLNDRILKIIKDCREMKIPFLLELNKFKYEKFLEKKIQVSVCQEIINVEGMENKLKNIVEIGNEFREKWHEKNSKIKKILKIINIFNLNYLLN